MTLYGYARVSSTGQSLDIQREALEKAGCSLIREEKVSGTKMTGRAQLRVLLDFMQKGDVLLVTRIDRLARSAHDLQEIVAELQKKGAFLKAVEQPIDMTTSHGRAFLGIMAIFAELETNLRAERQAEGVAKAKDEGRTGGRPAKVDFAQAKMLRDQGMGASEMARYFGCRTISVYRAFERAGLPWNG